MPNQPFSGEELTLLDAIHDDPRNDGPRLKYAAWIERQGDKSRSEQADFLRLDVEHEQLDPVIHGPDGYDSGQYDRYSEIRRRLQGLRCSLDPAWLVRMDRHLAIPPELSTRGKKAVRLILEFLLAERLTGTCGCRAFYSPQQWKERGEEFGHDALLILVYDSGDIGMCMDPAMGQHDLVDRFRENLELHGFVIEPCTHWYSSIYDEKDYKPFAIGLG
jgi:uncharacterized protein (TIGR02996 family)